MVEFLFVRSSGSKSPRINFPKVLKVCKKAPKCLKTIHLFFFKAGIQFANVGQPGQKENIWQKKAYPEPTGGVPLPHAS